MNPFLCDADVDDDDDGAVFCFVLSYARYGWVSGCAVSLVLFVLSSVDWIVELVR